MPALLALALLSAAPAQDVGEWQVGMGAQTCGATMSLRDGAEIHLSRSTTSRETMIRVTPPPARGRDGGDPFGGHLDLKIAGYHAWGETVRRTDGRAASGGGAGAWIDPDGVARILASGSVEVTGSGLAVQIAFPAGNAVERDLQACVERLRIAERGSGEPQAVAPRPTSDVATIMRGATAGLDHFSEGRMSIRLTVAAQGHVLDCTVTQSSGNPHVDARSCSLLRSRVRFTPAADAAGRPTLGTYDFTINWNA